MKTAVRSQADVKRILAANAVLLGEPQEVFLRRTEAGWFRVQVRHGRRWVRDAYKTYPTFAYLAWAAQTSHDNAHTRMEIDRVDCEWCRTHPNQGVGA